MLVPGLFGFARLGGFDYFMHVEEALETRFLERGTSCDFVLVSSPPTASIVYRTQVLRDTIERTCAEGNSKIHLIGHSTGGVDVRLFASPTTQPELPQWFDRVELPSQLVFTAPYVVTLLVLVFASQRLRPPASEGLIWRKGDVG